jgi:type III secretion protein J
MRPGGMHYLLHVCWHTALVLGVVAGCLGLSGCSGQELYGQLDERQANEMVAVLRNAGLAADKLRRDGGSFAVATSAADFSAAVEVLKEGGYPRDAHDSLGDVFRKEGFVSSPLEERARLTHALSQEIAHTLSSIDGVVMARVHLAMPQKDPLAEKPRLAAASVFIKHRPGVDLNPRVGHIKALVVNAIEGLPYDNVTVALFTAEPWPGATVRVAGRSWLDAFGAWFIAAALAACVLLAAALGWTWRRGALRGQGRREVRA